MSIPDYLEDDEEDPNLRYETCPVCKSRHEADTSSLGPPGPFCSDACVSKERDRRKTEIAAKHGLSRSQLDSLLKDLEGLPSYGRR